MNTGAAVALNALLVAIALSTMRLHLGASIEELEWTVNAYILSFAVLLMTGAALGSAIARAFAGEGTHVFLRRLWV